MKTCVEDKKIQTTMSYPLHTHQGGYNKKKTTITTIDEELEPSYIAREIQNGIAPVENGLVVPQKIKRKITILLSNSAPRYIPQRN